MFDAECGDGLDFCRGCFLGLLITAALTAVLLM